MHFGMKNYLKIKQPLPHSQTHSKSFHFIDGYGIISRFAVSCDCVVVTL